ncbi:hypothetical protein L3X38_001283 [Prunus dulcis]|uniref:Integrase catalytic domain-containing protein n=1 Tax=Prunus dulcis TaxID=3755 RepID=A0AAD4ZK31_PRUDU|nr:hypothetical protein L3X38_001283 [Prunus dulcis]
MITRHFEHSAPLMEFIIAFLAPHAPQQNGLAERKHCHIADMSRTLLLSSQVPNCSRVYVVSFAVFLINHLPSPVLHWYSPYCRLYGKIPSYSKFLQHKGYKCLDLTTDRLYISRHVRFDEHSFSFAAQKCLPHPSEWVAVPVSPVVPYPATLPNPILPPATEASSSSHVAPIRT